MTHPVTRYQINNYKIMNKWINTEVDYYIRNPIIFVLPCYQITRLL